MEPSLNKARESQQKRDFASMEQPISSASKKRKQDSYYEDDFEDADLETKKDIYRRFNGTLNGFPTGHSEDQQHLPIRYWPGTDVPRVDPELTWIPEGGKHRYEKKFTESGGYYELVPTSAEWAAQLSPTRRAREMDEAHARLDIPDAPILNESESTSSAIPSRVPPTVETSLLSQFTLDVSSQPRTPIDRSILPTASSQPLTPSRPLLASSSSSQHPLVAQPIGNNVSLSRPRAVFPSFQASRSNRPPPSRPGCRSFSPVHEGIQSASPNPHHATTHPTAPAERSDAPRQSDTDSTQTDSNWPRSENSRARETHPTTPSSSSPGDTTPALSTSSFTHPASGQPTDAQHHTSDIQGSGRSSISQPPNALSNNGAQSIPAGQALGSKPLRRRNPKASKRFLGFLPRDQPLRSDWQTLPIKDLVRQYPNHIWGRILRHLDEQHWSAAMIRDEMDDEAKKQLSTGDDPMSFMRHWILDERKLKEAEKRGEIVPPDGLVFTDCPSSHDQNHRSTTSSNPMSIVPLNVVGDPQNSITDRGNSQPWSGGPSRYSWLQQPFNQNTSSYWARNIPPMASRPQVAGHPVAQPAPQPRFTDSSIVGTRGSQSQALPHTVSRDVDSSMISSSHEQVGGFRTNHHYFRSNSISTPAHYSALANHHNQQSPRRLAAETLGSSGFISPLALTRNGMPSAKRQAQTRPDPLAPQLKPTNKISKKYPPPRNMVKSAQSDEHQAALKITASPALNIAEEVASSVGSQVNKISDNARSSAFVSSSSTIGNVENQAPEPTIPTIDAQSEPFNQELDGFYDFDWAQWDERDWELGLGNLAPQ